MIWGLARRSGYERSGLHKSSVLVEVITFGNYNSYVPNSWPNFYLSSPDVLIAGLIPGLVPGLIAGLIPGPVKHLVLINFGRISV